MTFIGISTFHFIQYKIYSDICNNLYSSFQLHIGLYGVVWSGKKKKKKNWSHLIWMNPHMSGKYTDCKLN